MKAPAAWWIEFAVPAPTRDIEERIGVQESRNIETRQHLEIQLENLSEHRTVVRVKPRTALAFRDLKRSRKFVEELLTDLATKTPEWLVEYQGPHAAINEGWRAYERGKVEFAIHLYRRVFASLRDDPQDAQSSVALVARFKDGTIWAPVDAATLATARSNFGVFLQAVGDERSAIQIWKLNGNHGFSLFNLAEVERNKGNIQAASELFRRSADLGNCTAPLLAYQLDADSGNPILDESLLNGYSDGSKAEDALEFLESQSQSTGDPFYLRSQQRLLALMGRVAESLEIHVSQSQETTEIVNAFHAKLAGPDRVENLPSVVAEANDGNLYALDALIADAASRDSTTEVDYWTKSKRDSQMRTGKSSDDDAPSETEIAQLVRKLGGNLSIAAVGVLGASNVSRFNLSRIRGELEDLNEHLGVNSEGDLEDGEVDLGDGDSGNFEFDFGGF